MNTSNDYSTIILANSIPYHTDGVDAERRPTAVRGAINASVNLCKSIKSKSKQPQTHNNRKGFIWTNIGHVTKAVALAATKQHIEQITHNDTLTANFYRAANTGELHVTDCLYCL